MARPIWKGTISFGLVSIPVTLHPAENRRELAFHLLDGRDMAPVHNKRVNERTGEEVPFEEIVKGYEYETGRFVVLGDEDFLSANVQATQTIDIIDFVRSSEIEPAYFDRPYYLAPTKAGAKGYALLREAIERAGYVGIAKIVIRTRQHLAAVVPRDCMLVLEIMRFAYEVSSASDLELPSCELKDVGATDKELAAAQQLIEAMVDPFDPTRYTDTYHDDLLALINKKVEAGELTAAAPQQAPPVAADGEGAEVIDIMALLKESVGKAAKAREGRAGAEQTQGARKSSVAAREGRSAG